MSTSRPSPSRLHLTLDEQSFQGLLSAAFTIQEHNDRRRQEEPGRTPPAQTLRPEEPLDFRVAEEEHAEHNQPHTQTHTEQTEQPSEQTNQEQPPTSLAPETPAICQHCGALKPAETSTCPKCGLDHFRPGERLQRNWASMWLLSQEQGLWPERPPETDHAVQKIQQGLPNRFPHLGTKSSPLPSSARERFAVDQLTSSEKKKVEASDRPAHPFESSALDESFPADTASDSAASDAADYPSRYPSNDLSDDLSNDLSNDLVDDPIDDRAARDDAPKTLMQRLADLSVTVRFHRADLYLGISLFVAVLALLWPAAAAPRHHALGPWERALITLGIAEAPAPPVVHLQGDPGIQVWVDTHSALYYCPGEEQYGNTAGGHVTTQREAQMDRFQPASRSVCD
jgi:ribosomal protein L40E